MQHLDIPVCETCKSDNDIAKKHAWRHASKSAGWNILYESKKKKKKKKKRMLRYMFAKVGIFFYQIRTYYNFSNTSIITTPSRIDKLETWPIPFEQLIYVVKCLINSIATYFRPTSRIIQ
jgi:hypothetical protein